MGYFDQILLTYTFYHCIATGLPNGDEALSKDSTVAPAPPPKLPPPPPHFPRLPQSRFTTGRAHYGKLILILCLNAQKNQLDDTGLTFDFLHFCDCNSFGLVHARIQRGQGSGPPPPPKNHKNIGFLSNTGQDPLIITKPTSQHSMLGHQRHAGFKWRFAGGPMMARR